MEWVPNKNRNKKFRQKSYKISFSASFQGVRRLFLLTFDNTDNGDKKFERDSHTQYFLLRVNITNYNVQINGRNFYDQSINDSIKR